MKSDIIVIGAGASGLMAAYAAARTLVENDRVADVLLLEKMPRPGRKIMITGKGRCNFTNLKDWNEFSQHIRSKSNFVKPSFYNFTSQDAVSFFEGYGMPTVVERGDRAYPASYHASDAVDTLVLAAQRYGVKLVTDCEVQSIASSADSGSTATGQPVGFGFTLETSQGHFSCRRLIIATGGLSYPGTGSTGDGYRWATDLGHKIQPLFPSLTALVPKGYKDTSAHSEQTAPSLKGHLHRSLPLTEYGQMLCGNQLKNVGVASIIEGTEADEEFGDIDFTDGGIEGPIGFQLSRKCVKAITNGSRVSIRVDLKSGVSLEEVTERVKQLWNDISKDPRSRNLKDREKCRILLGKLMPWDLIPG
ncbi:MAG: aminoacetone oxidase family FAD-binding enzyme [Bacteroidales bacterium]|nr:aminoacetone oxidase family FAD-binding enzyme [Bacteroidales bacterium]MCQ2141982.1 aminoacetone oxidase family FAD-binding enzyme [Bacteroidales bacterium]